MANVFKLLIIFLLPISIQASVSSGTIQLGNKNALICHSVDCITPTPGIINFLPTGTAPVTIDDTNGIDGVAWGNEIGWINFDPTGAEGLTIDANTGIISGKAWSQVSGWINFSVTGQSVKINTDGEFEGWAWTGGPYGGWIKFDCDFAGACVKTDWRPLGARPAVNTGAPTGSSGGSTVPNDFLNNPNDICLNIPGVQSNVPGGYSQDEGGLCLLTIDYCKNVDGVQLTIPSNYVLDGSGQCILLTEENRSEFFPDQQKITSDSLETYLDFCSNLYGLQSKLPDGFVKEINECFPKEVDYCPNILGEQYEIPKNMKITNAGDCMKMTKAEIGEVESIQKAEMERQSKNKILGYSFIPDMVKAPLDIPFSKGKYKTDLFSVSLTGLILAMLLKFITRYMKKKED